MGRTTAPKCIDCIAEGIEKARPIDPRSGPRSPRCFTHINARKKSTKLSSHERMVIKKYGMKPGDYDRLYEFQGGRCYMCPRRGTTKYLAVDHDHKCCKETPTCGKCNRGLLCSECNQLIGRTGDSTDFFVRGIEYLLDPPAHRLARADQQA